MWSLPDIVTMNAEAASASARKAILRAARKHLDSQGNPIHCDYCGSEAEEAFTWFDIFSADAKGRGRNVPRALRPVLANTRRVFLVRGLRAADGRELHLGALQGLQAPQQRAVL